LLGPSGCGKTTFLKVIAGLYRGHGGRVSLLGKDVTELPPYRRNVGVVFQNYALFPHLSVFDNVAFGVKLRPEMAPRTRELVGEALELVRLSSFAHRAVTSLSGGQQQRVAVARSMVVGPSILLLDEPFNALDRQLREEMQIELRQILRQRSMTAIFVTHDQEEAVIMSDRIVVMRGGSIEHEDSPTELFEKPRSIFVLDFVGKSTKLAGTVIDQAALGSMVKTTLGNVVVPQRFSAGYPVWVGIRADRIKITATGEAVCDASGNFLPHVILHDVINHGSTHLLILKGGPHDRLNVQILGANPGGFVAGKPCGLQWRFEDTLCFPRESAA
jgi:putative spermidine/putrescine transport system ATP-binding protein